MTRMDPLQHLTTTQAALDKAEANRAEAIRDRDAAIQAARDAGIEASVIAQHLGVNRQVIYRALRRH